MQGFPAGFEEQKDGSLTLDFVAAERKTMLASRKVSYHCRLRVDETGKDVLFYEILKEKGAGISGTGDMQAGFGFRKETYKTTGKERSGTVTESSTFLGQGYSLSFDYGLIRETVKREAEASGYTFSVTLRESSVLKPRSSAGEKEVTSDIRFSGEKEVKPGRWYYALSLLILIAGGIVFGLFLSHNISGVTGTLQRMVVPSSYYITLSQAGRHTIFYEYRSTVGGKIYATEPRLRGMKGMLVYRDTGEQVKIFPPSATFSYSSGVAGVSVMQFDIAKPGIYQFSAWYEAGPGPQVVLAIGKGFQERVSAAIMGSFAILFIAFGLAFALALAIFLKRRKAKKAMATRTETVVAQSIEPE
jgi:hypothetical protein